MSTVVATNIAQLRSRTEGFYGQGFGVLGSGSCLGAVSIYIETQKIQTYFVGWGTSSNVGVM